MISELLLHFYHTLETNVDWKARSSPIIYPGINLLRRDPIIVLLVNGRPLSYFIVVNFISIA